MNNSFDAFFALVRAGLWEKEIQLLPYGEVDYVEIMRHAQEHAVVGLVAAGLEHVVDVKAPHEDTLTFVGAALQIEKCNVAMNHFIADLIAKMRDADIYSVLVKGQGVAQCYERPLWRASGDVDFYLNNDNYEKAKEFLLPLAKSVEPEGEYQKHLNMTIGSWVVELHGSMRCGLSKRMDKVIDEIHHDIFNNDHVRSWQNGNAQVFLPSVGNDVMIVFTHYLKHFFKGGIGLRQICDWCRLLWTYRSEVNLRLLESRLNGMNLMSEWKAFGAYAVVFLGLPADSMPFYSSSEKWKRKAKRINDFILRVGNMGQNRDFNYLKKYPYLIRKGLSLCRRIVDLINHAKIFPMDSLRFFPRIIINGVRSAMKGE